MAEKYTLKTECGGIRVFEKSIMIEGMPRSYYFKQPVDTDMVFALKRLINDAFFIGKNTKAQEVSDTIRNLLQPTIECEKGV